MSETRPWFKFYPLKFMDGVQHLSEEEIGAYILALCKQWIDGSIPAQPEKFAGSMRRSPRKYRRLMAGPLANKFDSFGDRLKNHTLEEERQVAIADGDRSRRNGRKGGRPRNPAGLANKPDIEVEVDKEVDIKSETPSAFRDLALFWINELTKTYGTVRADADKWADELHKLQRIDGHDEATIREVVVFTLADEFWRENIRSPAKLRSRKRGDSDPTTYFQRMLAKMNGSKPPGGKSALDLELERRKIANG